MKFKEILNYHLKFSLAGRAFLKFNRWKGENFTSPKGNEYFAPPLKITHRTKELILAHYLEGRYANACKKVAWVTSGAPVEHLKALDFFVLYPENHGALCGARKLGVTLCEESENRGYSRDICSYARIDIGAVLSGKTPCRKLPKPDILIACTNICQSVLYWYRVLSHYFKVPLIVIDTPFVYSKLEEHSLKYVQKQIEDSISIMERVSGKSLQYKKLKKVADLSKRAVELWLEILKKARNIPSPITAFDQFIHMAPVVEMRGDEKTLDFYSLMLKEVDERIKNGISAIKNEKKRLLWDNLPLWYKLRFLSNFLAPYGASIVISTYTNAWAELAPLIEPEKPIESLAKCYTFAILNRSAGQKLSIMKNLINEYQIDGVILHSDRSCKPYSIGQLDQREYLIRESGVPSLLLDGDHCDSRSFSQQQVINRISAFMEVLNNA